MMTAEAIYPYIVPEAYLEYQHEGPAGFVRELGHGLHVALVFELTGLVATMMPNDLKRLGISVEQAHERSIQNLEELAKTQQVRMVVFPNGPQGKPFILAGGHWSAASAILLPRLPAMAKAALGSDQICVSIPHREAMLVFAKGDRKYRDEMRAMVREREGDCRKPLTSELFEFSTNGIAAFKENDQA